MGYKNGAGGGREAGGVECHSQGRRNGGTMAGEWESCNWGSRDDDVGRRMAGGWESREVGRRGGAGIAGGCKECSQC